MRILHSMLRVADLEAALEFYTRALDMRLLRRRDYPEGRFTLAFVGYQDERAAAALELTHNWDRDGYTQVCQRQGRSALREVPLEEPAGPEEPRSETGG